MLDERLEVNEYICDIKNAEWMNQRPERIKVPVFLKKNEMNGLERILTMIARYFIYEDGAEYEDGLRRAAAALRMWCGHAPDGRAESELADQFEYLEQDYPWIEFWISQYLIAHIDVFDDEQVLKVEKAVNAILDKKSGFSISSLNKQPSVNDYKMIRYDKIISNAAVSRGPLKIYYLACLDPEWERNVRGVNNGNLKAGQHDRVLKTIAAYMIERSLKSRQDEAPRFEPVNYMDITFWTIRSSRLSRDKYKDFTAEGRPLFQFQKGMSGNQGKIRPDPEWFENCGWQLIDATDDDSALDAFLDNHPDAIFYSDRGSEEPLALNERYERHKKSIFANL